ncbi:hypothetical protein FRB90_000645, partial [Tulasnella sp. 427]
MFDISTTPNEDRKHGQLPVIPVEEDSETLQALLQILYPIDPPSISSLVLAEKLVAAADKYLISTSKLRLYLQHVLGSDESLNEDPLLCYTLSWRLGLEDQAVKASRYTHLIDLSKVTTAEQLVSRARNVGALTKL